MGGICNKAASPAGTPKEQSPKDVRVAAVNDKQQVSTSAAIGKEKQLDVINDTTHEKDDPDNGPKRRRSHVVKLTTYGVNNLSAHASEIPSELVDGEERIASLVGGFAANVMGQSKDQDRFVCCPRVADRVFLTAIFDGHGRNGEYRAERAAEVLPSMIGGYARASAKSAGTKTPAVADLIEAITKSFGKMQKEFDTSYENDVLKPAVILKKQIEDDAKVDLGELELPQDGGTTATVLCVIDSDLVVAWVGDSRAVLAKRSKDGKVTAEALTTDHNVTCCPASELERLAGVGAEVVEKHLGLSNVEGMLQLTRSLGDAPFHRGGAVLHEPEITRRPIDDSFLFILAASDGLWDHFTNDEAVQFIYSELRTPQTDSATGKKGDMPFDKSLHNAVVKLEAAALAKAESTGKRTDDISVIVTVFEGYKSQSTMGASS